MNKGIIYCTKIREEYEGAHMEHMIAEKLLEIALKKEYGMQQLPITERIHNEELSLPISPLLTNEDIERIINCANTFI